MTPLQIHRNVTPDPNQVFVFDGRCLDAGTSSAATPIAVVETKNVIDTVASISRPDTLWPLEAGLGAGAGAVAYHGV